MPVKGKLILLIIVQCSAGYKLTEEIFCDKINILNLLPVGSKVSVLNEKNIITTQSSR